MSMYSQFATNVALERDGVVVDYGDFRVTMARAGGGNKKFATVLEAKTKPFKRAIANEMLSNDKQIDIMREVYAETCVLNWETKLEDGSWVQGIEVPTIEVLDEQKITPADVPPSGPNGLLPFNKNTVLLTFRALPDIFIDLQQQANKAALYKRELREAEAGN
jgi:hypothetical protein